MNMTCKNCKGPIHVMAFRGEDFCSGRCRDELEAKKSKPGKKSKSRKVGK